MSIGEGQLTLRAWRVCPCHCTELGCGRPPLMSKRRRGNRKSCPTALREGRETGRLAHRNQHLMVPTAGMGQRGMYTNVQLGVEIPSYRSGHEEGGAELSCGVSAALVRRPDRQHRLLEAPG